MSRRLLAALAVLMLTACGPGPEGPAGPAGPTGPQGPAGATGATGAAGLTMTSSYLCRTDPATAGLLLTHKVYGYSDGTVMAYCEVFMPQGSFSGFAIYKASQAGSVSAGCVVGADLDTVSDGYWLLTKSGASSSAVYKDTSSGLNTMVLPLTCAAAP